MRRVVARICGDHPDALVAYQGAWAVPWFADIDRSRRRILCLHDSIRRYAPILPSFRGLADGIICNGASTAAEIPQWLPGITAERIAAPLLPIVPPAGLAAERNANTGRVVGFAGRVERAHKGAHRLVPFVAELRRLGLDCRVEVMGDGRLLSWLQRRLRHDDGVRFLGRQGEAEYWRRFQTWDAIVSFSDHEGGPITLLEAMAAGTIPVYPAIGGSLGDDYAPQVDPRCHYAAGDPLTAARTVEWILGLPAEELQRMRAKARAVVQPHASPTTYEEVFAAFAQRIATLPRISREPRGDRRARLEDWLPLGLVTRWRPGALNR